MGAIPFLQRASNAEILEAAELYERALRGESARAIGASHPLGLAKIRVRLNYVAREIHAIAWRKGHKDLTGTVTDYTTHHDVLAAALTEFRSRVSDAK